MVRRHLTTIRLLLAVAAAMAMSMMMIFHQVRPHYHRRYLK